MILSENKRIAKNTVMLYIRMIISVCVSLFTSRLILKILGVEDFGIYNIIGGIVAVMGFLNSSMAGCTSRFLTYELGRNDRGKLRQTFNATFQVHVVIAIVVFILGETLGLWFINTQLVLPESSITISNVVYQCSLLSTIFSVIQIPYSATIIAHERMDVYAYVELLNVFLRLCVVLILPFVSIDKLIAYSLLLTIVYALVFLTYRFFCKRNFEESTIERAFDKLLVLPMLKFASWDMYGNMCVVLQQQGLNTLINRFFGVALNAATGVATQASSVVSMFVSSFTMALRPPIIKKYALKDFVGMQDLLTKAIVLCVFLAEIICLPLYLRIDKIMSLWLVDTPPYAVSFCKWMLLANSVSVVNPLFTAVIHATGNIKRLSLITGTIYLLTVVFSYFAFKYSCGPNVAYVILFVLAVVVLISNALIAKMQIPELSVCMLLRNVTLPCVALFITIAVVLYVNRLIGESIWGIILLFIFNAILSCMSLYILWIAPKYGWNLKSIIKENEV